MARPVSARFWITHFSSASVPVGARSRPDGLRIGDCLIDANQLASGEPEETVRARLLVARAEAVLHTLCISGRSRCNWPGRQSGQCTRGIRVSGFHRGRLWRQCARRRLSLFARDLRLETSLVEPHSQISRTSSVQSWGVQRVTSRGTEPHRSHLCWVTFHSNGQTFSLCFLGDRDTVPSLTFPMMLRSAL